MRWVQSLSQPCPEQGTGQPGTHKNGDYLHVERRTIQVAQKAGQTVHGDHHERCADRLADRQPHPHHQCRHDQKATSDPKKAGQGADPPPLAAVTHQLRPPPAAWADCGPSTIKSPTTTINRAKRIISAVDGSSLDQPADR